MISSIAWIRTSQVMAERRRIIYLDWGVPILLFLLFELCEELLTHPPTLLPLASTIAYKSRHPLVLLHLADPPARLLDNPLVGNRSDRSRRLPVERDDFLASHVL